MTRAAEYRDQLAQLADEHGFAEGDPMRASLMLCIACGWLEAKDKHIEFTTGRAVAVRGREAHSHAERGTR